MLIKRVLEMFGLLTYDDHQKILSKHSIDLLDARDALRGEKEKVVFMQRMVGDYLISLSFITENSEYHSLGQSCRSYEPISYDNVTRGACIVQGWFIDEVMDKRRTANK
ncbi:hypothetical protein IB292_03025 [Vibrio parahaemolyticus]|uniref:Uncharacterized protein n=1 Tax=Vibrio parahaemolyticus TaxID=670 RepID=A0A9Q3UB72_VIBPH|nr:hypothetical protein [Vibrio parahaemolyticus]MCC3804004.1 hypothetical protein [Vibrio parahaemolyticus]